MCLTCSEAGVIPLVQAMSVCVCCVLWSTSYSVWLVHRGWPSLQTRWFGGALFLCFILGSAFESWLQFDCSIPMNCFVEGYQSYCPCFNLRLLRKLRWLHVLLTVQRHKVQINEDTTRVLYWLAQLAVVFQVMARSFKDSERSCNCVCMFGIHYWISSLTRHLPLAQCTHFHFCALLIDWDAFCLDIRLPFKLEYFHSD